MYTSRHFREVVLPSYNRRVCSNASGQGYKNLRSQMVVVELEVSENLLGSSASREVVFSNLDTILAYNIVVTL